MNRPCNRELRGGLVAPPMEWFQANIGRVVQNATATGRRAGFKAGTRYGMAIGAGWGVFITLAAVAALQWAGWWPAG